jgi:hypothetical protein
MGIWADDRNSIRNTLPGHHRVEEAVGILQIHMGRRVTSMYGLEPPLDPLAMRAKYHPGKFQPIFVCCRDQLINPLLLKRLSLQKRSASAALLVSQPYSLLIPRRNF